MGAPRGPGWKIIKFKEKQKEERGKEEDLAKSLG